MSTPPNSADHPPAGAAADPSMEDILASIRRILSEDEVAPGAEGHRAEGHGAEAQGAAPPHKASLPSDVLMLDESMMVATPAAPVAVAPPPHQPAHEPPAVAERAARSFAEDFPVPAPPTPTAPEPRLSIPPVMAIEPAPAARAVDSLVAPEAAAAVASTLGSLVRHLASERQTAVHRGGPTIEDLVREEIRPLLKQWLDSHLPVVVEHLVRAEIERVVGRSVP